jgi:hypothetical protein
MVNVELAKLLSFCFSGRLCTLPVQKHICSAHTATRLRAAKHFAFWSFALQGGVGPAGAAGCLSLTSMSCFCVFLFLARLDHNVGFALDDCFVVHMFKT